MSESSNIDMFLERLGKYWKCNQELGFGELVAILDSKGNGGVLPEVWVRAGTGSPATTKVVGTFGSPVLAGRFTSSDVNSCGRKIFSRTS